ncbi:unnamed protein product [marine sediment metagenome]|uniref:Uncharacterized protein n=1 Tax=marine sediment metagenome TaxID=412755 RepID=X1MD83_9ZZZZ
MDAVKSDGNQVKVVFTIHKEIELPQDALAEKDLHALVGKKIKIFNSGDGYKLRVVDKTI